jgi:hypothetical protein
VNNVHLSKSMIVKFAVMIFFSICLFFVRNQSRLLLFVTTYSNVQSSLVVWCAKVTRRRSELSEQLSPRSLASWAPPDSHCTMGPNPLWNSPKPSLKIRTANTIFWIYLGGTA